MLVALMDVGAPRRCRADDRCVGWRLLTMRVVVSRKSRSVDIDDGAKSIDAPLSLAPTLCCFGTEELAGPSAAAGRVTSCDVTALGAAFGPCPRVAS